MNTDKIEIKDLYLVFGHDKQKALKMLRKGKTKQEILKETGCTIAVNNANFTIRQGEIFVIMGLSGSGKSSLLRCLNLLNRPTSGKVIVNGKDIAHMGKEELRHVRRRELAMVFQHFGLLPHRTVLENIAFGLELQGVDKTEREQKARECMSLVKLDGYADMLISELSGGMQQRVGLARALANDPEVLLMDEAFSALDPLIRIEMQDELLALMNDEEFCREKGFTPDNIPAMLLPDTYDVYWNISAKSLLDRMEKEYNIYWNDERREKARQAGLSPIEVATLASIVEEETNIADEMPIIAGLYINRLRKRIPLQADPTIKFAVGDFGLKRILRTHLRVDSPYTTYKHYGLPPGPIRIASKRAIEAVLNYDKNNYIYMCAKDDLSGRHNFAATLTEHNYNARQYHKALNALKIMK